MTPGRIPPVTDDAEQARWAGTVDPLLAASLGLLSALRACVRVIDDSEMLAYMHYVLVRPTHHGQGIAGKMVEYIKEKYKHYLYIELMPEERKNAAFYENKI